MGSVRVRFQVAADTRGDEVVYVVGDCPALGQWQPQGAAPLELLGDSTQETPVWEGVVRLPRKANICYRFLTARLMPTPQADQPGHADSEREVILWETNIQPRHLTTPNSEDHEVPLATFGSYDGSHTLSQGWLEKNLCAQVRLHGNPIQMWKARHNDQKYSVKCSPLDFEPRMDHQTSNDEQSLEGPPLCERTSMAYYNLNSDDLKPSPQPAQGCVYNHHDYLVFTSRGFNTVHLGFQLDFFVVGSDTSATFVGSAHLLPPSSNLSFYSRRVPIIGLNHRPIGEVRVEVLRITPLAGYDWRMDVSYQNHWKWRKDGETLNVGHRGMGSSYKRVANARENTVASLFGAAENGADFVEFDVLLTKDQVPVIYHDFSICLSTASKAADGKELLEVAVKDLCLSKLQSLKLFHTSSSRERNIEVTEVTEESQDEDHHPFPTLRRCLERVHPQVGFNIEVKFPQDLEDASSEMENYFDLNRYLDCILDVVFKFAGSRKIIFSSFHADSCIMLNLKQNKYPVLLLSNGPTTRYVLYSDWRCNTFKAGISFAKAEGLLGVNYQAEGLLQDLTLVKHIQAQGLVLFVWGEDLNDDAAKQTLRQQGVDAIIFDRIGNAQPDAFLMSSNASSLATSLRPSETSIASS